MNDFKIYFTTGELAKLFNISKQTLIYYDNIGIFKPDYKDENSFRFYSLNQYEMLDTLLTLRDLGMSLDEIKGYIDNRTPQLAMDMFINENKKIEEKIKMLKGISKKIQDKINVVNNGMKVNENVEVYVKEVSEEYLILSDFTYSSEIDIIFNATELIKYCNEHNIYSGHPIGAKINKENIGKSDKYDEINSLFIKVNKKVKSDKIYTKPSGLYACINHVGSYETIYKSYNKLLEYVDINNYKIIGDSYEWALFDALIVKNKEEYLTEITVQIEKNYKFKNGVG